jgi:Cof subfamily protein (haloacid dehalogenase superfamily)
VGGTHPRLIRRLSSSVAAPRGLGGCRPAVDAVRDDRVMTHGDWRALAEGVRLVATDLDGTLLRADGSVSAYTVDAFARARAAAVPVVFVTGRPPRWLPAVVEATGHSGVAICANGAVLLDLGSGEMLRTHPIGPAALDQVVTTLRAEVPGIGFAAEWVDDVPHDASRETEFAHEHGFVPRYPVGSALSADDIRELTAGHRVVKLLARLSGTDHDADSFLDHALEHVEHFVTVTHSSSGDVLIEMSAHGVSKGSTLAAHAASLGLTSAHVAAVGDMPNDLPMIEWARVGLAVEGAHLRLLEVADAVLPGPQDDGVGRLVAAVTDSHLAARAR